MDIGSIQLHLDGVTQSFAEWTRQFADTYYPYVGQRCYRVPAIHFNEQRVVCQEQLSALLLHPPEESKARGELAHTVVLENVQHLGHSLQREGCPLFIISTLNYDNYLHRVKPPPLSKGRENRPPPTPKAKNREERHASHTATSPHDSLQVARGAGVTDDSGVGGDRAQHGGHGPTAAGGPWGPEEECQTDMNRPLSKAAHKRRRPKRKKAGQKMSPDDGGWNPDVKAESERSSNPIAEHVRHTTTTLDSQEDAAKNKHATSGSWPGSVQMEDDDSPRWEAGTIVKESSSPHHCAGEPGTASQCLPSPPTPPRKRRKKKHKTTQLPDNSAANTRPLERVDGGNNPPPPTSSTLPQQSVKVELPPRPQDMTESRQRGDIDVLLLHQQCGVILMEVKSTGMPHPQWHYTDQDIVSAVHKAVHQLAKGRDVFRFIMADISDLLGITLVVALPFVSRRRLNKVLPDASVDPDIVFLSQDDLVNSSQQVQGLVTSDPHTPDTTDRKMTSRSPTSRMVTWWEESIAPHATPLPLDLMKTIVGRVCGLLSVVSVWTKTKPRVEVRTTAQAISEAADRISDIVLLPEQADLLAQPRLHRLCLTGPMGSGKTLLLQLKGRQWLQEGRRVVVVNIRTSGRGRPAGHVMEEAIGRGEGRQATSGSVERHDLATKEYDKDVFRAELEEKGPMDKLCFILDELTHYTFPMLEQFIAEYPHCRIWCVAMFVRRLPSGFHHYRLGAVLRSPPSVQLLLKELDLNPVHTDVYSTRSAIRGLPCDGPPVVFLHHQQHDTARRHQDCTQCADELVTVLQGTLGLQLPCPERPQEAADALSPHRSKRSPCVPKRAKAHEAKSLSFRDVLFLICVPLGYYEQKADGLWMAEPQSLTKFIRYLLSSPFFRRLTSHGVPLKVVIDNTSREIAFPSTNEIVVTDVMAVPSLERKVVIYLPGGSVLDNPDTSGAHTVDCNQPSSIAKTEQLPSVSSNSPTVQCRHSLCPQSSAPLSASPSTAVHPYPPEEHNSLFTNILTDLLAKVQQNEQNKQPESVSTESAGNRPDHAACEGSDAADCSVKEGLHELASSCPVRRDLSPLDVKSLFGNMMVDGKVSEDSKARGPVSEHMPRRSQVQPRMGMDMRGDSPMLLSALEETRAACESRTGPGEDRGYFQADSAFLVPDVGVEVGQVEAERQRVQHVVASLSMDDQDWLFMAAARCLSQLIVIVP